MKKTALILVFILVCACCVAAWEPQTNEKNALRRGLVALLKRLEVVKQGIVKRTDVNEKVKTIIIGQLSVDAAEITSDAKFIEDLGADSLDTVELVMRFEEEFGIEIPDEESEKILTVQDAINYIIANEPIE